MKRNLVIAIFVTALVGCQKAPVSPSMAAQQSKSQAILAQYARGVSKGYTEAAPTGFRGATSVPQYSQNLWDGAAVPRMPQDEAAQCAQMAKAIPVTAANYQAMVSTLARCLNRVSTWYNPVISHTYRNMNQDSQLYWLYLMNYRSWSQYSGKTSYPSYGQLPIFAGQGYPSNY